MLNQTEGLYQQVHHPLSQNWQIDAHPQEVEALSDLGGEKGLSNQATNTGKADRKETDGQTMLPLTALSPPKPNKPQPIPA